MTERFDLVAIGGGSGGLAAAQRAAEYGARVAVVEKARLGGTCVNVGCVPKKVMWHAAELAHGFREAAFYGFDIGTPKHDWGVLRQRRDAYVERLNDIYARNLDKKKIPVYRGPARFVDSHTIDVAGVRISAERFLIATGGEPEIPDLPGAELGISSDGFFELPERPQRVAVVGSGYIAVELAGVLRALGSDVDLLVRVDGVLRNFDPLVREGVEEALQADGIRLLCQSVPKALTKQQDGLHLATQDGRDHGPYDTLLWAIGRGPLTSGLGLDIAGVHTDADGFVSTDKMQQTNVEHIFAIGDVTGRAALTPVAIAAGRRLSDRLYGGMAGRYLDYANIASVVFSHPPVGTVGLTEPQARELHGDAVKAYTSTFVPLLYGVSDHKPKTRMKLVTVGPDEIVVGCHLCGPGSDEILQGFAVAVRMGARKRDLDDTVAIHPTSAEELVTMR